ncbi:MAG: NAD(P)/FAD-dependent oxidoreductase [Pirellulales bacterium]
MVSWDRTDSRPQVIVIGGGPAGSTVSTILAQQGVRVVLYERERFPRFHIGESLIPETYWTFKRLGMLPKLKASRFTRKESVQFINENGKLSEPFYFTDYKPGEQSQTWQVRRSEFDQMMLDHAREHGVEVHQGVRVLEVLFEGERAVGVRLLDEAGATRDVMADVVVDASGQTSMIANRLKLRRVDPDLKKGSVWTYYEGARRDSGRDEGATLVIQTKGKKGWFWYIPLHDNIVSVGVVADFRYLFDGRGDHETIFAEELDRCPAAKERVEIGRRVTGFYATKDFSYHTTRVAGPGWVTIGDAFGFLDPLYSSGVLLALRSGELAADAIVEGLAKGDVSGEQLGKWAPDFERGMDRMRRLVVEFYDGFNFGRFIKRNPHLKGQITDLLIGDMFRDELDVIVEPMNEMRREQDKETGRLGDKETPVRA